MKKGCVVALVMWGAATIGYLAFLRTRMPWPQSFWVSAGEGLMLALVIGSIQTAISGFKKASKVSSATTFSGIAGEAPKDGQSITAIGRIRATGPVLTAPFSGKPAVLYSYDVKDPSIRRSSKSGPAIVCSGYALTPSVIDTREGTIRLLAFPTQERSDTVDITSPEARQNAASWIAGTQFTDATGLNAFTTLVRDAKEVMTDDDGEVRKDWKMLNDTEVEGKRLFEYVVAPGEQVCLMGTYSAARGGVVPNISGGETVQLLRGDPSTVAHALRMKAVGAVIAGLLLGVFANGFLLLFLKFGSR